MFKLMLIIGPVYCMCITYIVSILLISRVLPKDNISVFSF